MMLRRVRWIRTACCGAQTAIRGGRLIRASSHVLAIGLLLATGLLSITCGGGSPSAPPPSTPAPPPPPPPPPPPNSAPAVAIPIPDVPLERDRPRTFGLGLYFSDPDGDTLTYAATTSDALVVTATVSGSSVTLTAVLDGAAAVSVTATDPGGLSATQTFHAIIGEAQVLESGQRIEEIPTGADALSYEVVSRGSVTLLGDTVTIDLEPPEPSQVAAQSPGATLPVPPEALRQGPAGGWVRFRLGLNTVTCGCLGPRACRIRNNRVTSGTVYRLTSEGVPFRTSGPRRVGRVEDRALTVDSDPLVIATARYFADPDRQPLTFKASSSDPEVVKVDISGDTLTIEPLAIGEATIQVTATDSEELSVSQTFTATVRDPTPVNRRPLVVQTIPDQVFVERGPGRNLVLSPFFSDPDDDVLEYQVQVSDSSVLRVSVINPGEQRFIPTLLMNPRDDGTAMVSVTATDSHGLSVTQTFQVTVRNVNQGPFLIDSVPFLNFVLGDEPMRIELSAVFADPDDDILTYTYALFACRSVPNPNVDVVTVQIVASIMTVIPTEQGRCSVTVTATDPGGLTWFHTVLVTVEGPPRMVDSIPDLKFSEYFGSHTLDLSLYFIEYDAAQVPTYSATSDNPSVVKIGEFGGAQSNELTLYLLSNGTATVTVTAADNTGSVTQSFTVTVGEPNRGPEVIRIPDDITIFVGQRRILTSYLAGLFEDPDGDLLKWEWTSDSPHVRLGIDMRFPEVTGVSPGSATITVTATDGELTATLSFVVTVLHNDPPRAVGEMPDQMLTTNDQKLVDLSVYFEDPNETEGDRLTYSATSSDASVEAIILGRELALNSQSVGSATITVTASDRGRLVATQEFAATVSAVHEENREPRATGRVPHLTLTVARYESESVALTTMFTDPDGDPLTYDAASSDSQIVDVGILGNTGEESLNLRPLAAGTATVTVTASDPEGLTATQAFTVTVRESSSSFVPVAVGQIPDQQLTAGGPALSLSVYDYFIYPGVQNGWSLFGCCGVVQQPRRGERTRILLSLAGRSDSRDDGVINHYRDRDGRTRRTQRHTDL